MWKCICDCGTKLTVVGASLVNRTSQSCGCLKREKLGERSRLNLLGKKFGRLFVIKYTGVKNEMSMWKCQCDCGAEIIAIGKNLVRGNTKSCGCLGKELTSERFKKDITGQRFGRLLVLKESGRSNDGRVEWLCKCDCGNEITVVGKSLRISNTQSCGCLWWEEVGSKQKGKGNFYYKHGLSKTRAYKNARSMIRIARKFNQTPSNADQTKIQKIYSYCAELNRNSSIKFEVDHIIPLSKKGLHHQDNLQILKANLNNKKRAKITDEYQGITLTDIEAQELNVIESVVEGVAL